MPRANRFLGSRYLSKDDVEDMDAKDRTGKVDHISVEVIDREDRLVLYCENWGVGLPLNRTNIETMIELANSDDTDSWRGIPIEVYLDRNVMYRDRRVGGIRICSAS